MAKTRMLKHDVRRSVKVASWPIEVRYFWVLLWGYVDDHGKGVDNSLLVKADCFPLDPDITGEVVDGWLWTLAKSGVIIRYTVDGTDYLSVKNWREHQKPPHPTEDVLPPSDDPRAVRRELHEERMKDAGTTHEAFTPVLGWVESEFDVGFGSEIESSPAATVPDRKQLIQLFDDSYEHWPKKVEREPSKEKFLLLAKTEDPYWLSQKIIEFGDAYAATTAKQFIPALAVWLKRKRWTDELPSLPEAQTEAPRMTAAAKNMSTVAYFQQQERQEIEQ